MKKLENFKNWNLLKEDLDEIRIPKILKTISIDIRKDLIDNGNNSFAKPYSYDIAKFNVIVEYTKGKYQPYSSNLYVYGVLENPEDVHNIPVKVQDFKIDIDYLLSVIIHEVRHIYDINTLSSEYNFLSFVKEMKNKKYKNSEFEEFAQMIYLSLEHELIARHNMLYPLFRWVGITNKNELMKLYKEKYVYQALVQLNSFDYLNFINKFIKSPDKLLEFTNIFIKEVAMEDNVCKNNRDLIDFYKKWAIFFKEKSKEFLNHVDSMFDEIIEDVKNDKITENVIIYEYNEYNIDGTYKIFKEFYKEIFHSIIKIQFTYKM